ncbi:Uncharacterised protein [uncultured archaeon]|nr:Uncharacterised protein [uncultured archaeon]
MFSPDSSISRVTVTVLESTGIFLSELSRWQLTLAIFAPCLVLSTSCNNERSLSTLITLGVFSPRANEIASNMLLFPEPFAPDIAIRPCSKLIIVFR